MTLQVTTNDCSAVGDADLADMADLTAGTVDWEVGELGKQAEDWVLATTASRNGNLKGFVFSTLERLGGSPAMVIGLSATAWVLSSSSTLRALM